MTQRFQALREVREFVISANTEIKIRVSGSLCGRSVGPGYSTWTPYRVLATWRESWKRQVLEHAREIWHHSSVNSCMCLFNKYLLCVPNSMLDSEVPQCAARPGSQVAARPRGTADGSAGHFKREEVSSYPCWQSKSPTMQKRTQAIQMSLGSAEPTHFSKKSDAIL